MMTELILTLKSRCKAIPYVPQKHEDGTVNHGFCALKGRPEDVAAIPEARDSEALRYALATLNRTDTAFLTVGCEQDLNQAPEGFWQRGYVEFSFSDALAAAHADYYFQIFFQFNRHVWKANFDWPIQYHFELEEADFLEFGSRGFTAAVWMTTLCFPTAAEALSIWHQAVVFLADFLVSLGSQPVALNPS